MKLSGKAIVAIVIVVLLAATLLLVQQNASGTKTVKMSAHDMQVFVSEVLPPAQQQQLASSEEQRKQLAKRLKELLSLAQVAEQEGMATLPDVKSQIDLQTDLALREAYEKKNASVTVSDEEVASYHLSHPNEWNQFLDANPQFKSQAQGPGGEGIKKEFGQIKLLAERARKDGLDREEGTKMRVLLSRSQALARAYVNDLQKNPQKLMSDADIDQYYRDNASEFEEIHARHILISTRAEPPDADPHGQEKPGGEKPKTLTKDEARAKAQGLLDRIRKGEDFSKLAGENSDDPESKVKGGDLGFFSKGTMVPQFQDAAFALKPGEVSNLVETEFGFHIIRVEDRRTKSIDDPQARQQITEKVRQDRLQKHIEEITAKSSVEVAEDFDVVVKPAQQPEPPSPTGDAVR
jgi:parvulin-like peptidyl-prolyl isomerase